MKCNSNLSSSSAGASQLRYVIVVGCHVTPWSVYPTSVVCIRKEEMTEDTANKLQYAKCSFDVHKLLPGGRPLDG